jgi:hypothetical protein
MTNGKRRSGAWSRLIETIAAWEKAIDYTPYDYALDRIGDLERQVTQLRAEVRMLPGARRAVSQTKPASSTPAEAV